jgi:Tfp pilus assembly protein PilF
MDFFEKHSDPLDGQMAAGLNNLGVLRHYQGRDEEAIQYFEKSVETSSASVGPNNPTLIKPLSNLGTIYSRNGRIHDSVTVFQRAVKLAENSYGTAHPIYGTVLMGYADSVRKEGHKGEAKKLASKATTVLKDSARTNGNGMTVDVSSFRLK